MWRTDGGLLLQRPYLLYSKKKKSFQHASPLMHAMETVVCARTNTAQANDHSLENTAIKNSAPASSLWSPGTVWPKKSYQNSFLPTHFDWKAHAQLLGWELVIFQLFWLMNKPPNSQMWLLESNDSSHEHLWTGWILVRTNLCSSKSLSAGSFSGKSP